MLQYKKDVLNHINGMVIYITQGFPKNESERIDNARCAGYNQAISEVIEWLNKNEVPPCGCTDGEQCNGDCYQNEPLNYKWQQIVDIADKQESSLEFRSIISHALLGYNTENIPKETWDLIFDECTKYATTLLNLKKR